MSLSKSLFADVQMSMEHKDRDRDRSETKDTRPITVLVNDEKDSQRLLQEFTASRNTSAYQKHQNTRSKLPAADMQSKIVQAINDNQVFIRLELFVVSVVCFICVVCCSGACDQWSNRLW